MYLFGGEMILPAGFRESGSEAVRTPQETALTGHLPVR
jgi:hypothetical protein